MPGEAAAMVREAATQPCARRQQNGGDFLIPNASTSSQMHSITSYSNPAHRLQVIQLWDAVFGYETAHNTPGLAIDKKLAAEDGLFFVALAGEEVIGTILAGYDGHRGWLYAVAVHPSNRHKGLGSALVRHAEQALTERGCMKINLQIMSGNEGVGGFYESLGYAVKWHRSERDHSKRLTEVNRGAQAHR
jgi:ribosomal protein S18 acetylase RimI-like enzyme